VKCRYVQYVEVSELTDKEFKLLTDTLKQLADDGDWRIEKKKEIHTDVETISAMLRKNMLTDARLILTKAHTRLIRASVEEVVFRK